MHYLGVLNEKKEKKTHTATHEYAPPMRRYIIACACVLALLFACHGKLCAYACWLRTEWGNNSKLCVTCAADSVLSYVLRVCMYVKLPSVDH